MQSKLISKLALIVLSNTIYVVLWKPTGGVWLGHGSGDTEFTLCRLAIHPSGYFWLQFLVDELGRPPRVFTLWVPDIPRRVKMHWQGNVIRRILGLERFKKLFKDLDKFLNILFKTLNKIEYTLLSL